MENNTENKYTMFRIGKKNPTKLIFISWVFDSPTIEKNKHSINISRVYEHIMYIFILIFPYTTNIHLK